ncbi:MAG TPA: hypothetical protein VGE07_25065 [Herpetosiphonaceae bacterium]
MSQTAHEQQLLQQLKDERSTLHDLAWELDEVELELAEIESQSTAPVASGGSLDHLRARRTQLEEAVLQQMLYIDRLQHTLDQHRFPPVKAA